MVALLLKWSVAIVLVLLLVVWSAESFAGVEEEVEASIAAYSAVFQEDLLKVHHLDVKQHLVDALVLEKRLAERDVRPAVRLVCVDHKDPLPVSAVVVSVDRQSSTMCYFSSSNISLKSVTIPPVLKIQRSVLDHVTEMSSTSRSPLGAKWNAIGPYEMEPPAEILYIELRPDQDGPSEVISVAREILLLAPLVHRFRLSPRNNAMCETSLRNEWHCVLMKIIVSTMESEAQRAGDLTSDSLWTRHIVKSMADLTEVVPVMTYVDTDDIIVAAEDWLQSVRLLSCPSFDDIFHAFDTDERQRDRSPNSRLNIYGNSIQLNLSTVPYDTISLQCLVHIVHAAAAHPLVVSVSVGTAHHFSNYDAVAMSQSGTARRQPFRNAGLKGHGQVCGVADTGLDDTSCFFRDHFLSAKDVATSSGINNSDPYDLGGARFRSPTTKRSYGVESRRRKVIQYVPFADSIDSEGGHGTHVVGTIAGHSISNKISREGDVRFEAMNGVAPLAKVAFFDIAYGFGNFVFINLPRLQTNLFPTQHHAGARVSSNSWAGGTVMYSQTSYEVDAYLYNHQEFLVVVASGNGGLMMMNNIASPGNSKNAICVGATQLRDMFSDAMLPKQAHTVSQFNSIGPTLDGRLKPDILATGYYVMSAFASSESNQLKAQHVQYGQTVGERVKRWDNITANGKKCAVHEKSGSSMATPVVSGVALLIREYFMNDKFWTAVCVERRWNMGMCESKKPFEPSGYMTKSIILHAGEAVPIFGDVNIYNAMGGPPPSLLEKPLSGLKEFSGGWYRGLASSIQGYGELNLESVLPLPNSLQREKTRLKERDINLAIFDQLGLQEFEVVEMDLELSSPSNFRGDFLKTTLCWYDPPSGAGWAATLLVHDIDLLVVGPYTSRKGEAIDMQRHPNFHRYWGNNVSGGDRKNPNEQIYLQLPHTDKNTSKILTYTIYLIAHAFPVSKKSSEDLLRSSQRGVQNVAVTITSYAQLSVSKFRKSLLHPDDLTEVTSDRNWKYSIRDRNLDDSTEVVDEAAVLDHASVVHDLFIDSSPLQDEFASSNDALKEQGFVHRIPLSEVNVGIRAELDHGVPVLGRYVNDASMIGTFVPMPADKGSLGKAFVLTGVSVCLDAPHVDVNATPPSGASSFPRRPGVDAYLFALTITSPNNEVVQVGGFQWTSRTDGFYHHNWPFLWMAPSFKNGKGKYDVERFCFDDSSQQTSFSKHRFAAYRDVSLAKLFAHSVDSEPNNTWMVQAFYGITPLGATPTISFTGQLQLYFQEIGEFEFAGSSAHALSPASPPSHPNSSRYEFELFKQMFAYLLVATIALAFFAFIKRVKQWLWGHDVIDDPPHQGNGVDYRTPLSRHRDLALNPRSPQYGSMNDGFKNNEGEDHTWQEAQGFLSPKSHRCHFHTNI